MEKIDRKIINGELESFILKCSTCRDGDNKFLDLQLYLTPTCFPVATCTISNTRFFIISQRKKKDEEHIQIIPPNLKVVQVNFVFFASLKKQVFSIVKKLVVRQICHKAN